MVDSGSLPVLACGQQREAAKEEDEDDLKAFRTLGAIAMIIGMVF